MHKPSIIIIDLLLSPKILFLGMREKTINYYPYLLRWINPGINQVHDFMVCTCNDDDDRPKPRT